MRNLWLLIVVLPLFNQSCYKKFEPDETLHSSMLDEAYSDYYSEPWFYLYDTYYEDNSEIEDKEDYLHLYFKIPHKHLENADKQTVLKITHINAGKTGYIKLGKNGEEDVKFKVVYYDPTFGTNYCFKLGAYNEATAETINEFEFCYLLE